MRPISVALAIGDTDLRDELRAELSRHPARIVIDQGHIETLQMMRLPLDMVIIDTTPDGETVNQLIQRIRHVSPRSVIAVAGVSSDTRLILDCMHAGANQFVLPPFQQNVRLAVERALAHAASQELALRPPGKVIGFVSAKGGCGATTVACHIAAALERSSASEILLADFDMETGLVGFLVQPKTTFSVVDAMRNIHRLDAAFWKRHVGSFRPRLDVLPSPMTAVRADGDWRHVLRLARAMYGWIVVDLGRGLNAVTLNLLEDFDELYLVTTPAVGAVFQARQFIQRVAERGFPRTRLRVIVNRARRGRAPDVHERLGAPVYAAIEDRPELESAYAEGRLAGSESNLGAQFASLAARIADVPLPAKAKIRSLFGLWKAAAQAG